MTSPRHVDPNEGTARLLKTALNEEADMVQTDPTALQRIQNRTSQKQRFRSRWLVPVVAAGVATAAVITAVTVLGDDGRTTADPPPATQPPTAVQEDVEAPLYYVGVQQYVAEGGAAQGMSYLYREVHPVGDGSPLAAARAFLAQEPADPDYQTGWPDGVDVAGIETSGSETVIDLTGDADLETMGDFFPPDEIENAGDAEARATALALQALIASAGITEGTVAFTHDGQPLDTVLGMLVSDGYVVESYADGAWGDGPVRALVSVASPVEGETVTAPVVVTGEGNVFEGNVNWILTDESGAKVDDGFVTTAMGSWKDFEVDLGGLEPGTYTFRALEYSAANGEPLNVDDKTFTVE